MYDYMLKMMEDPWRWVDFSLESPVDPTFAWGLYFRLLGVVCFVAFIAFVPQIRGLIGNRGISPWYMMRERLLRDYDTWVARLYFAPTILWLFPGPQWTKTKIARKNSNSDSYEMDSQDESVPGIEAIARSSTPLADWPHPGAARPQMVPSFASDLPILMLPVVGCACALLMVLSSGWAAWLGLLGCALLLRSIDAAFTMEYPWDSLLLETTSLSLFLPAPAQSLGPALWALASPGTVTSGAGLLAGVQAAVESTTATAAVPGSVPAWAIRMLLFRVMFGFGKLKFFDTSSHDITYIKHFFISMPMCSPLGWIGHHTPDLVHIGGLAFMFLTEIPLPFFAFFRGGLRLLTCLLLLKLQVGIQLTGNFGYFNLLTAVLCVPLLDLQGGFDFVRIGPEVATGGASEGSSSWFAVDPSAAWVDALPSIERLTSDRFGTGPPTIDAAVVLLGTVVAAVVAVAVPAYLLLVHLPAWLFMFPSTSWVTLGFASWPTLEKSQPKALTRPLLRLLRFMSQFRLAHAYGVFPPDSFPSARFVVVYEGSVDGKDWQRYHWRYFATDEHSTPPLVAPWHPRLDHAIFYEGHLGASGHDMLAPVGSTNPYRVSRSWIFRRLQARLLEGSSNPCHSAFFQGTGGNKDPFPDPSRPPNAVRASLYMMRATSLTEGLCKGRWWNETRLGTHLAPVWRDLPDELATNEGEREDEDLAIATLQPARTPAKTGTHVFGLSHGSAHTLWAQALPPPELWHPEMRTWRGGFAGEQGPLDDAMAPRTSATLGSAEEEQALWEMVQAVREAAFEAAAELEEDQQEKEQESGGDSEEETDEEEEDQVRSKGRKRATSRGRGRKPTRHTNGGMASHHPTASRIPQPDACPPVDHPLTAVQCNRVFTYRTLPLVVEKLRSTYTPAQLARLEELFGLFSSAITERLNAVYHRPTPGSKQVGKEAAAATSLVQDAVWKLQRQHTSGNTHKPASPEHAVATAEHSMAAAIRFAESRWAGDDDEGAGVEEEGEGVVECFDLYRRRIRSWIEAPLSTPQWEDPTEEQDELGVPLDERPTPDSGSMQRLGRMGNTWRIAGYARLVVLAGGRSMAHHALGGPSGVKAILGNRTKVCSDPLADHARELVRAMHPAHREDDEARTLLDVTHSPAVTFLLTSLPDLHPGLVTPSARDFGWMLFHYELAGKHAAFCDVTKATSRRKRWGTYLNTGLANGGLHALVRLGGQPGLKQWCDAEGGARVRRFLRPRFDEDGDWEFLGFKEPTGEAGGK